MDNKVKGALAALVGSLCLGGAQLMDMESRIAALEEAAGIEPEPVEESSEESSEEPAEEEEGAPAESSEEQ
jgi:hypothetical protein